MSEKLSLKIATKIEELERVTREVEAMGQREDWPPKLLFRVNLVLEELALNIINHGHSGGVHEIEITLNSEPDRLTIEVTDDGRPFDPVNDLAPPDVAASLEDRAIGGLGVHLVRTLMDELTYRRDQGKNHVALVALKGK